MKTAISLSDDLFERAERLAAAQKRSRSQLYARALAEYLARHEPDSVTSSYNDAFDEAPVDEAVASLSNAVLAGTEW